MIRINTRTLDAESYVGDTIPFHLRPKINGEKALQEGDTVRFALKRVKDNQTIIEKTATAEEDGLVNIVITAQESESLEEGNYIYGLRMIRDDGATVDTLLPEGKAYANLTIKKGV